MAANAGPAEQRAHLLREMARQSDRASSRNSNHSSTGSINGAAAGYETFSQQLPPHGHELDFQINTSALKRAFPNFSQYGSSSDEDSIEVGRGLKTSGTGKLFSNNLPSADITEDLSFEMGDGIRYRVTGTPSIKPRTAKPGKQFVSTAQGTGGKENQDPLAAEPTDVMLSAGGEADAKRNLDLQPTVESVDNSISNIKRPASFDMSARNTRFDNSRKTTNSSNAQSTRRALSEITTNGSVSRKSHAQAHDQSLQNITADSLPNNGTSFILPDIPQITELISGIREDGTPMFSRSAKPKSRFQTTPQNRRARSHVPMENVPIPTEEKVLFMSLQLLQEKVASLEKEKAITEQKLEGCELEVLQLRSKLEEQQTARYRDSGLGSDHDDIDAKDRRGDKSRLESSMGALQDRLDRANRKLAASEMTIKNLTKDRDTAHQQLALANMNSEELHDESQVLSKDLEKIKIQLSKVTKSHEKKIEYLIAQEAELRQKIERREKAINEMGSLVKELWITRNALSSNTEIRSRSAISTNFHEDGVNAKNSRTASQSKVSERSASVQDLTIRRNRSSSRLSNGRRRSVGINDEHNMDSDLESTTHLQLEANLLSAQALPKDETFLSFMEGDEVAKLRKIVEDDKARLDKSGMEYLSKTAPNQARPRKSSMKRTGTLPQGPTRSQLQPNMTANQAGPIDPIVQDNHPKQTKENTHDIVVTEILDNTQQSHTSRPYESRRRQNRSGEVTSAFIVPDITLTGQNANEHDMEGSRKAVIIPRPVPVSDRIPDSTVEEPTIRPAQDPGLALAVVIKGLEDEIRHLRGQFAYQESLYNQHDPALSKRVRKMVYSRMQKLLAAIDLRADQIYALYDVLEGQKAKGQTMKEAEIEITLRDIGIDPAAAMKKKAVIIEDVEETVEYEDEDDLPWEGIEATNTQTLPSLA